MSFLKRIDALYEERKNCFASDVIESNFCCYFDIQPEDIIFTSRFIVKKQKKAKLLIATGKQRVYLSDYDIISIILKMDTVHIKWLLNNFIKLYNGSYQTFKFKLEGEQFIGEGIGYYPGKYEILLFSDTVIDINDFIFVLNFIFAKDKQYEKDKNKKDFRKGTIVKYITLIDYYANRSERSKKYLDEIGYPTDMQISQLEQIIKKNFNIMSFDISKYL